MKAARIWRPEEPEPKITKLVRPPGMPSPSRIAVSVPILLYWLVYVALIERTISVDCLPEDRRHSGSLVSRSTNDDDSHNKLLVDILFKPSSCPLVSQVDDQLAVTYVGTLTETGKQFDASQDPKDPFVFTLGVGEVILGWDQGMLGMCEGEKRVLKIPSELGYGHRGAGADIPPDASLTFRVELIEIQNRKSDLNQLEIQTTYQPASCPIKSENGDQMAMTYVGTLKSNGAQFDAIKTPDSPFEFKLGAGQVIEGWDQGLKDMCVGERRKLVIPASMAYGAYGDSSSNPPIPPNADLVFDTELIDIRNRSHKADPDRHEGRWLWSWSVVESLGYFLECLLIFF
ncbi:FK-506 binding protein [Puccinia graminis f. sp. tritici]|uniref:peptidylprolyl isomerase n=1 Tax=Puccinia graminis f. sp. tritici TaxID=56615 RepID=A0A5B0RUJ5_PUCGR|nr:FK-506 binding protein [Puccinia graminis f. sp. tritici]